MKTIDYTVVSPEVADDGDAVLECLATGKPLAPETRERIRARGRKITEELRQKYGEMNIAVEVIRETRDE
jgi:hypothetical protein